MSCTIPSGKNHRRTISLKEAQMSGTTGKRILIAAIGLLLAAGIPYLAATTLYADPGSGRECKDPCGKKADCGHECGHHEKGGPRGHQHGECAGCPKSAGQAVPPCMQDNAAAAPGGMQCMKGGGMPCGKMAGRPPMREGMARHMEETRGTIAKLRALEAKMESLTSKDDAAAFRAASIEHSKLLTGLQESHLKHMEGMMGGK
jgi:hypothetical protein